MSRNHLPSASTFHFPKKCIPRIIWMIIDKTWARHGRFHCLVVMWRHDGAEIRTFPWQHQFLFMTQILQFNLGFYILLELFVCGGCIFNNRMQLVMILDQEMVRRITRNNRFTHIISIFMFLLCDMFIYRDHSHTILRGYPFYVSFCWLPSAFVCDDDDFNICIVICRQDATEHFAFAWHDHFVFMALLFEQFDLLIEIGLGIFICKNHISISLDYQYSNISTTPIFISFITFNL